MPKRTFHPKKIKRARRLGFRSSMKRATKQKVIKRRRFKGRATITR